MREMNIVLKKPVLTEKSMRLAKDGYFTFLVDRNASKAAIIKAVKNIFGVDPVSSKVLNYKPVIKLQKNRRRYTKTSEFKKAVIKLKKGQKIDIFQPADEKVELGSVEGGVVSKEKKSMLKGTKVKIERGEKK